jgi:hypothetical protein
MLGLEGQEDIGDSFVAIVLHVVDPYFSLPGDFLLLVVVPLRGFRFGGGHVPPFSLYFYLSFNFILEIVRYWRSIFLVPFFFF